MSTTVDESSIRIAVVALFLAGLAVGVAFRLRAARGREDLWPQRREEGVVLLAMRAVAGLGMFGGLLAYLVDPALMAWSQLPLPAGVRWAAIAAGATGVPLLYWVLKHLGGNLTDTVAIRRGHTLVTSGPYRWVRHPFYVVASLQLVAASVALANWSFMLGIALFWVYLWRRTPLEEAKLIERFGDEYREYTARTGRFVPRPALARPSRPDGGW